MAEPKPIGPPRRDLKSAVRAVARRLPSPRDKALLRTASAFRDLLTGRHPKPPRAKPPVKPKPVAPPRPGPRIGPPVPPPPQVGMDDIEWATPPDVFNAATKVQTLYDPGEAPLRYDLELLEKLNAEYADKPVVPHPPGYSPSALTHSARRRALWVHNMVDLMDKRTLEIGCGNGFEVWHVAEHFGADAYGVDVTEYGPWSTLASDKVHFECADMATSNPFEENYFDRIMSFAVWEHVLHPYAMLQETYKVLKPGGLAWIYANLYPGPRASHRYGDFNFPWPHLLFSDDVIKEWDRKHGKPERGNAWVNRLCWRHYAYYFELIGFKIRTVRFTETQIDEDFYKRFEDILGRFPRYDLKRDFFLAVLEKPESA